MEFLICFVVVIRAHTLTLLIFGKLGNDDQVWLYLRAIFRTSTKAVVLLLVVYCYMYLPLFMGRFCVCLCFGMHYFMSFLVL